MVGTEEGRLGAVACLAVTLVLGLAVVLLAGAEEGCAGDIAAVACLAVALGAHSLSWARPPQGGEGFRPTQVQTHPMNVEPS